MDQRVSPFLTWWEPLLSTLGAELETRIAGDGAAAGDEAGVTVGFGLTDEVAFRVREAERFLEGGLTQSSRYRPDSSNGYSERGREDSGEASSPSTATDGPKLLHRQRRRGVSRIRERRKALAGDDCISKTPGMVRQAGDQLFRLY
jgi:hypothetical protein